MRRGALREALGALLPTWDCWKPASATGCWVRASSRAQSAMVRRASSAQRDNVFELRAVLEEYTSGAAALRRSEERSSPG